MFEHIKLEGCTNKAKRALGGWSKSLAIAIGVIGFGALSANAATITLPALLLSSNSPYAACPAGTTGTFTYDSSGGVNLTLGAGGCGVFGSSGSGDTTYISGLTGEGTAAQLFALTTGWYAESGEICNGLPHPAACTASNSTTNNNTSGDIEVLINSSSTTQTFQIRDNLGNIDTAGNPSTAPCTYTLGAGGAATFSVGAGTICLEDLSTGGSIAFAIAVPEPSTTSFLLMGGLLLGGVRFLRRRRVIN